VALVAALHVYCSDLEMFLWTNRWALKTFRIRSRRQRIPRCSRQPGLYNGFLAAGLVWGLVQSTPGLRSNQNVFFALRDLAGAMARDREPQDIVGSGSARRNRTDPALAGLRSFSFRPGLVLRCHIRSIQYSCERWRLRRSE